MCTRKYTVCFVPHLTFVILLMVVYFLPFIEGSYLNSTKGDLVNSTKYRKRVRVIPGTSSDGNSNKRIKGNVILAKGSDGNSNEQRKGVKVIASTNNENKEDDSAFAEYGEELPQFRCKLCKGT